MAMTAGMGRNLFSPLPTPFNLGTDQRRESNPFTSDFAKGIGNAATGANLASLLGAPAIEELALPASAFAESVPFAAAAPAFLSNPVGLGLTALAAIPLLGGLFNSGPSEAWRSFGPRLAGTLTGERGAASDFLSSILGARSPQDLESARQQFLGGVQASGVGGFATRGMPSGWVVPELPGATGTSHEGGLLWNPNAFNSYLNALYSGTLTALQSPNKFDLKAFQNAAMPLLQQAIQAPGGNTFGDMPGLGPATATPTATPGVEGATFWNPLFMGPVQGGPITPQGGMSVGRTA